jgi:hypothetical protein
MWFVAGTWWIRLEPPTSGCLGAVAEAYPSRVSLGMLSPADLGDQEAPRVCLPAFVRCVLEFSGAKILVTKLCLVVVDGFDQHALA